MFSGRLTFALDGEDGVGVEEAFVQTRALSNGVNRAPVASCPRSAT
ncbi:hypothetical protein LP420_00330 [Massilia sp. B-10]|nr:hypothetical protein LP420_00330 [Massilia sp. B-10]